MKFHVEIDCTPEELRRLMGLPDLAPLHDSYQSQLKDLMSKGVTPDVVEALVRSWSPLGQSGFDLIRSILKPSVDGKVSKTGSENSVPEQKS